MPRPGSPSYVNKIEMPRVSPLLLSYQEVHGSPQLLHHTGSVLFAMKEDELN